MGNLPQPATVLPIPCKGAPAGVVPVTQQKGHVMAPVFYALASLKARLAETDKERGATAVEYALLIGVVSIGLIVALSALNIDGIMDAINAWLGTQAGTIGN